MAKKVTKAAISLTLIFALLWFTDVAEVWHNLTKLRIRTVLIGLSIFIFAQLISSWRWKWIIKAEGEEISLLTLFSSYMIGMFINNFMPSSIGGDVFKTYDIYRITGKFSLATVSVFIERFSGLIVLLILPLSGIKYFYNFNTKWLLWGWILLIGFVLLGGCLILKTSLFEKTISIIMKTRLNKLACFIQQCYHRGIAYTNKKLLIFWLLLLSVPVQVGAISVYWLVAKDLGVDLPFNYYLFIIPFIAIVSLAPISIGGFGVREFATVLLLGAAGVSQEVAISISVLQTCILYITSLTGGIFFLFRKDKLVDMKVKRAS